MSILDLNTDCITHLCTFLDPGDILIMASVVESFGSAVTHINVNDLAQYFQPSEAKMLLVRIGKHVKDILMDTCEDNACVYVEYLREYCNNLESLESLQNCFNHPHYAEIGTSIKELIYQASMITVLKIFDSELQDGDSVQISQLTQLHTLSLSHNCEITGKYLHKLVNLRHLNLKNCVELENEYFIEICKATKLKSLNIVGCHKLRDDAYKSIENLQTDLETFAVDNWYVEQSGDKDDTESEARFNNLKHLLLNVENCLELLKIAAANRGEFMESLEFHNIVQGGISITPEVLQLVLKFKNLKKLGLNNLNCPDNLYLDEITKMCSRLEEIQLSNSFCDAYEGVVAAVENLENLKVLDISYGEFETALCAKLLNVLKKKNRKRQTQLRVYAYKTKISELIQLYPEYQNNLLALEFEDRFGNIE